MSIANDIKIAKVAQVLAIRDIEKGKERDFDLPRKLYTTRKGVDWLNTNIPSDTSLSGKQSYMVGMYGKYSSEARGILALGASGQNVSAVFGSGSVLMPYPINVTISTSGSTLTNSAWVGLQDINTAVINNVPYQSGTGFTFNSATGTFDFSLSGYVLQIGDTLTALGFKPTASSGSISGGTGSFPTTAYVNASAGLVTNIPVLVGKTISLLLRGGLGATVITSGTIVGGQIYFDNSVGTLRVLSGNDWVDQEPLIIQYY